MMRLECTEKQAGKSLYLGKFILSVRLEYHNKN